MSLFQPYRPRRPTRAENEKNEEQLQYKRERQGLKRKRERKQLEERSSKLQFSEHNGIGYQDYTLGPSGQVKNRGQLDRRAYAQHRSTLDTNNRPFLDSVPSLADCCLDLVAENYGEPGQLDKLDRFHHLAHVKPLFDRVRRIRNDGESRLPFEFWLEFALSFGMDLPSRWKTYRGLVVSGDQEELDLIREYNEEAVRQSIQEPAFAPSFFLATLDLSNDTTLTDADVYKLRNPLSSFLAVLKLDSTAITDVGVTWIARVAADGEAYKHLEVLSLKGLTGVTDDGAARLSTLSNLRMLDLRSTQCTSKIVARLNNIAGGDVPFAPCQARNGGIRNTLIEFQIFGGSLSSSRILSYLHYLAKVLHSSGTTRYATIRSPFIKPLSLHLSAMTRKATLPLASSVDKTAEQLYQEQLALSGFSGSARATHHAAFGTLTSTKSLARKLVADDGRAMSEKGAAFRNGVGDSVAAGEYVGAGRVGGRASLFDVGTRKLTIPGRKLERDPFSDTEDEAEKETTLREEEAEELRIWEEKTNTGFSFYAGKRPVPRPERVILAAAESVFILLRHLPYISPVERTNTASRPAEEAATTKEVQAERRVVQEGATLLKKKRRVENTSSLRPLSSSSSSSPAPPLPQTKPSFPSSSNLVSQSSTSTPPCAQPRSTPSNPFAKKSAAIPKSAARTASKNIIKVTPTLAKRSSLSAFKR